MTDDDINAELAIAATRPASKGARADIHRMLPANPDAEMGVLASFLLSPREVGWKCAERGIRAESFHIPAHATIFAALWEMWDSNKPIDFIALTEVLRSKKQLDEVGGAAFVTGLFTFVSTAAHASYYIDIVEEKSILREIIKTCTDYAARSYDESHDVPKLLDGVEQSVLGIRKMRSTAKSRSAKDVTMEALMSIQTSIEMQGRISGLTTGFATVDMETDGLHKQEMIVVAARPSMGKTAFVMNIAETLAVDLKKPIAVFSLEMSAKALTRRLILSRARVNLRQVREGTVTEGELKRIAAVTEEYARAPIHFEEGSDMTIQELRARARRLKAAYGIEAVFIDSLSVVRSSSKRAEQSRHLEVAEASNGFKEMSKELDLPVVVIAHLGRKTEARSRPVLSDLRESGNIEQDADSVYFIVRPEEYADNDEEREALRGQAELIIAKQREGDTGIVPLTFLKEFARFECRSFDPTSEPSEPAPYQRPSRPHKRTQNQ